MTENEVSCREGVGGGVTSGSSQLYSAVDFGLYRVPEGKGGAWRDEIDVWKGRTVAALKLDYWEPVSQGSH